MFFWKVYEFSFVFGWISRKMEEISKIWANYGVLCYGVGALRSSIGPHQGMACPRCGMAEKGLGQALGMPQRSSATPRRRSTPQRSSATSRSSYCSHHGKFWCFVLFYFSITPRTRLLD